MSEKWIVFLVERDNYYKFYSLLIEKLIEDGKKVWLLHRKKIISFKDYKVLYYPAFNKIPLFKGFNGSNIRISYFRRNEELTRLFYDNSAHLVFSIHSMEKYNIKSLDNIKWFTLQSPDTLIEVTTQPSFSCDMLFLFSRKFLNFSPKQIINKLNYKECGLYYCDKNMYNKPDILFKYNLPINLKYLLYIPLSNYHAYPVYSYSFLDKYRLKRIFKKEINMIKTLSAILKEKGWGLLIKSRYKRILGKEYEENGYVFYDETYYPQTLYELLKISSLVVSAYPSFVITEAIFFRLPYFLIANDFKELDNMIAINATTHNFDKDYSKYYYGSESLCEIIKPKFSHKTIDKLISKKIDKSLRDSWLKKYFLQEDYIGNEKEDEGWKLIVDEVNLHYS